MDQAFLRNLNVSFCFLALIQCYLALISLIMELISLVTGLFFFSEKGFLIRGNFPLGHWNYLLFGEKAPRPQS